MRNYISLAFQKVLNIMLLPLFSQMTKPLKINPALSSDKTNAVVVKDSNWKDKNVDKDLEVIGIDDFVENLPGYKPQNLTMNFMITFLFVISATVIGVFLYVITLQKRIYSEY